MKTVGKILRIMLSIPAILVGLVLLVLALFYVPPIQDLVIGKVLESVNEPGEFEVKADKVRISFPTTLTAENLVLIQKGDTTVTVGSAKIETEVLPLFMLDVSADSIVAENVHYRSGNQDSLMMIDAKVKSAKIRQANINLNNMAINAEKTDVSGGKIFLSLKNDTTTVAATDTASEPTQMKIRLSQFRLHEINAALVIENVADSILCDLGDATLKGGKIDLAKQSVNVDKVEIDSLSAKFLYPIETVATEKADTTQSLPWDVKIGEISISNSDATYAMSGAVPQEGLDFNYLSLNEIGINIQNLHNRGAEISIPTMKIDAIERSGVSLHASGGMSMDSVSLNIDSLNIGTSFSRICVNGQVGMGDFASDTSLPLNLDATATIAKVDLKKIFPSMAATIASLPAYSEPTAGVSIHGTTGKAVIDEIMVSLPGHAEINASGSIAYPLDADKITGKLNIDGYVRNSEAIKGALLAAETAAVISVPDITLAGKVDMNKGKYSGNITGVTATGDIAIEAGIDGKQDKYSGDIALSTFPVQEFLPTAGLRDVTAHITANADGIDPFDVKTTMSAEVNIDRLTYNNRLYTNLLLGALVSGGNIDLNFTSLNHDADLTLNLSGVISPQPYDFDYSADIRNLNLKALELTETEGNIIAAMAGHATLLPDSNLIDADIVFSSLKCSILPSTNINTTDINATLHSNDSALAITLDNRDLKIKLNSPLSLNSFTERLFATVDTLNNHIERQRTDIESLQKTMPQFTLDVTAKRDNLITSYLTGNNLKYNSFDFNISNDSLLAVDGSLLGLSGEGFAVDTAKIMLRRHGKYLTMKANLDSKPGTMDEWAHVEVNGFVADSKFGLFMRQSNIDNKIGYRFGTMANLQDSVLSVSFVPYNPVIAYKEWTINDGNLVAFDFARKHLDADLLMKSDESLIHLYTELTDTLLEREDLKLKIENIKIADWIALNPYAPKIKGDLFADLTVRYGEKLEGCCKASIREFYYGKQRVGTFDCDIDVATDRRGRLESTAMMDIDGKRAMTAYGYIADSTAVVPFLADFELSHFPLKVINPFLPPKTAKLTGEMNGQMDVTGSVTEPKFNGYLRFDSTELYVNMIGTSFKFDNRNIPIDSNVVYFDKFAIKAINENPLTIDGNVNMRNIFNPKIDLTMLANNMQVVNSNRASKGAEVYGKAFIDLNSYVKGDLERLNVKADLTLLPQTNVTYVMTDAQSTIEARQKSDMVKFVNLNDTTSIAEPEEEPVMALDLSASLKVSDGCTINADLSANGKDKASLKCNGAMAYTLSAQGDERMTGRLNITGGFARYTPPLLSEKLFTISDGNYVLFTGDMMNPTIKFHAVDKLKANVTQEGQNSRLIEFEISLNVTGTLERMNITFDLATNDDITIQNELQAMSAEQRATQAMNLLLYNVYTGPGTKASSSLAANPLYTFLESQINSWAANNIKGVDISFGIDTYNKTTDGSEQMMTNYSYKVSKTLFNDRFKIVVGGNYSNDADSDAEVASALLNDVSFEYSINPEGTMVIRIYRHTGYEDILEGEITQTGAGFVYKRKILKFTDIFRPHKKRNSNAK